MSIIEKIFGTHSERELKSVYAIADKIESYRPQMQALSDEELRGKTKEYKERLAKGETLDDLLPELLQLSVRQQNVCSAWSITGYSSSVVSFFIRDVSRR